MPALRTAILTSPVPGEGSGTSRTSTFASPLAVLTTPSMTDPLMVKGNVKPSPCAIERLLQEQGLEEKEALQRYDDRIFQRLFQ